MQEPDPVLDLFQNGVGNPVFRLGELQAVHKFVQLIHRHLAQIPDILIRDVDGQRFLFQTFSVAGGTGRRAHIPLDVVFHPV